MFIVQQRVHYNQISHFLIRIITLHRKKKITTNTLLPIKIYILVTAANRSKDRWKFSACVYIQWSAVIECLNTSFPDNLYIGTLQWKEKNNLSCLSYVFNWRKNSLIFEILETDLFLYRMQVIVSIYWLQ